MLVHQASLRACGGGGVVLQSGDIPPELTMDIVRPLAFALVLMVAAAPTFAQQRVYQWKDAQGVTHYTDCLLYTSRCV